MESDQSVFLMPDLRVIAARVTSNDGRCKPKGFYKMQKLKQANILLFELSRNVGLTAEITAILGSHPNRDSGVQLKVLNAHGQFITPGELQRVVSEFHAGMIMILLNSSEYERFRLVCEAIRNVFPIIPIFAAVEGDGMDRVVDLLQAGATDFTTSPLRRVDILPRIWRLLEHRHPDRQPMESLKEKLGIQGLIGENPRFVAEIKKIPLVAKSNLSVLISGETGTGKEIFSRAIHYQSPRNGKPFVPVNCGALPDHLFENELFGHAKGAFTDASSAAKGLIDEAEGGTLFLDEVDTLSHAGQVKLLRFLQDGEYRPVGSVRYAIADVRVIAATNADLRERVRSQQFREDFFHRLNPLSLSLPALRERIEDIAPLTLHFLDQYAVEHGQEVRAISAGGLDKLMGYSWPGNIRELESVITRAMTFSHGSILEAEDIELPTAPGDAITQSRSLREAKNNTIASFERRYLAKLLAQHQGNVTHAARAAGKERRSFQRLLRKHSLDRESFHG